MSRGDLFILAGNGPYDNRGCEAITRGTISILRKNFNNPHFVALSNFTSYGQFERQKKTEEDTGVTHIKTWRSINKLNPFYYYQWFIRKVSPRFSYQMMYKDLIPYISKAKVVLAVGGDKYTLDYGYPVYTVILGNLISEYRKPLVIWGASVGPFSKDLKYERFMADHLVNKAAVIFVRESISLEYLLGLGVKKVYLVADPAFCLDEKQPMEIYSVEEGAVGINLSPLLAKYIAGGNRREWVSKAGKIIAQIKDKFCRPIYLIPHITHTFENDYIFMRDALSTIDKTGVHLVPPNFNAAETKWIIGRMAYFIGARTHATIAAISSAVPTLSLAYSVKALGINKDIFGHTRYCLQPNEVECCVIDRLQEIINNSSSISNHLRLILSDLKAKAFSAGEILKNINFSF